MKIAIGVPNELDGKLYNGFITAFRDINMALADHQRIVFAPSGGDVDLEGGIRDPADPMNQYYNTESMAKDFAKKVGNANPDAILAFTMMGRFISRKHITYTSNVPYKKAAKLIEGEYPETAHFEKLARYYRFVAGKERENYEKAERIIVLSNKIRELIIEEHGISPDKITYIPRPIPRFNWVGSPKRDRGIRFIIMPAELRVMKGIRYAIETMKILKKTMPEAVLVICGRLNNYERDYIKSLLADAKGKANIILAGFLGKEPYHAYLKMADCAFMPFCFDECPIALSECIGHGLPVVTNEYAGYEKKIIDTFGYCARHKDTEDYAEGLTRMLSDSGFAGKKAEGAKSVAQKFNFDRYRREVKHVFEEFGEA
ncbi:glycosyltransferase family 4 protein [Candidatus Micrarchaeota archaeon]|nr:glycosyltransferase family 4 protein [Candidatus Micrarchaeota archaeon]